MMIFKIVLIIVTLSLSCFATNESYDQIALGKMPAPLAKEVIQKLNDLHFKPVFSSLRGSELLRVNLMFSDSFLSSKIIFKYDVQGNYELNKEYKIAKGVLYHLKLDDKESAIYFENLNNNEVKEIIKKLMSKDKVVYNFSFFPKAHAACDTALSGMPNVDVNSEVAQASLGSILSNCMTGIGDGVEESTIGVVSSVWDGLSSEASRLWDNPGKRLGEYWGFVSDGAQALWDFLQVLGKMLVDPAYAIQTLKTKFGEIGQFFVDAYNNIAAMPANQKAQMFCNILGSIGVDVLIAAVTVGAASGKLGVTVSRLLLKLKKIANIIGKGIKVPFKVLEKISDDFLRRLKAFNSVDDKVFINRKLRGLGCAI